MHHQLRKAWLLTYAQRVICAVAVIAISTVALADIYKTTDLNGNVSFSNTPSPNAQRMNLPPITIVAAPKKLEAPNKNANASNTASGNSIIPTKSYTLTFNAPKTEQVVFKANGSIPVDISLTPTLKSDARIVLYLDDQVIGTGLNTDIALSPLSAGKHWVSAKVFSNNGDIQGENKVSFNIFDVGGNNDNRQGNSRIVTPQPFLER